MNDYVHTYPAAVLRFELAAALWLLCVDLERPASLDEWRRPDAHDDRVRDDDAREIMRKEAA